MLTLPFRCSLARIRVAGGSKPAGSEAKTPRIKMRVERHRAVRKAEWLRVSLNFIVSLKIKGQLALEQNAKSLSNRSPFSSMRKQPRGDRTWQAHPWHWTLWWGHRRKAWNPNFQSRKHPKHPWQTANLLLHERLWEQKFASLASHPVHS